MRFDHGTLTFKALLVVHEATEQANGGTVKITVGLRFALACLFATGQTKDAKLFKNFAECLADRQPAQIESFGNYLRSMQARDCRGAIMRNAGIEACPDNETMLREAFDRLTGKPPANAPDGKPRSPDL